MNYWPQADKTHSDSPVTVTVDDRAFWCDTSLGAIVFNLPNVVGKAALYFVFKKMTSDTNTVTINAPAGKNIDGASSYILTNLNQIIGIVADTSGNFKLVDGNSSGAAVGTGRVALEKVDGNFAVGSTLTTPSGMTYALDMQTTGTVVITVSGAFSYSFQAFENAYIGIEVDGTQYYWPVLDGQVGAGSDSINAVGGSHTIGVQLNPGSHTIKALVAGHQHTGSITVYANASNPLSLVIQYPTVVNFGGGSPTSDPTNDLAGTWDTVQVVGLQDDPLPVKVGGGFLRRNQSNTGWEEVLDITNVVLDAWRTPRDITLLNATKDYHGLLPKLPNVGGLADVTNFLRADGTWAPPPSVAGSDVTNAIISKAGLITTDRATYKFLPRTIDINNGRAFAYAKANPGTTLTGTGFVCCSNFGAFIQPSGSSASAYTSDLTLGSAQEINTTVGGGMGYLIIPNTATLNTAFVMTQFKPYLRMRFKTNSVLTNTRIWVGFFSGNPGTSDDPAGLHIAAFRFSSTASDTTWRCCTKDGSTLNNFNSGVTVAADTIYTLEIQVMDDGTIQFRINNNIVHTGTTNLPTTTTQLANPGMYGNSPATAAFVVRISDLYVSQD